MDFLSIILSAIGWEKDRVSKVSDRKLEAYRLNAEVAAECMRTVNMLTAITPGLMRKYEQRLPENPELVKSCADALNKLRSDATQLQAMAESYKPIIEKAGVWADWDTAMMRVHNWHSTVMQAYPHAEGVVRRLEEIIEQVDGPTTVGSAPQVSSRDRDRGWDAPPL
ncbi:hypothetical protein G6L30_16295 [Agrobacterium rhizogenes]|nr:hypothetical protein [Rhizobium rhizogenes]NTG15112.1 hypothetical protein [Rhizobium rhizogenes]